MARRPPSAGDWLSIASHHGSAPRIRHWEAARVGRRASRRPSDVTLQFSHAQLLLRAMSRARDRGGPRPVASRPRAASDCSGARISRPARRSGYACHCVHTVSYFTIDVLALAVPRADLDAVSMLNRAYSAPKPARTACSSCRRTGADRACKSSTTSDSRMALSKPAPISASPPPNPRDTAADHVLLFATPCSHSSCSRRPADDRQDVLSAARWNAGGLNTCMSFPGHACRIPVLSRVHRWLRFQHQAVLHIVLLAASFLALRLSLRHNTASRRQRDADRCCCACCSSVGSPFFLVRRAAFLQRCLSRRRSSTRARHSSFPLPAISASSSPLAYLRCRASLRLAEQSSIWTG